MICKRTRGLEAKVMIDLGGIRTISWFLKGFQKKYVAQKICMLEVLYEDPKEIYDA